MRTALFVLTLSIIPAVCLIGPLSGPIAAAPPAITQADDEPGKRLTRPEKRRLGILPRDLIAYGLRLEREGIDLRDIESSDEQCQLLIGEAIDAQPAAWADPTAIDWDAILDFIERLLPIILKFIEIFGGL